MSLIKTVVVNIRPKAEFLKDEEQSFSLTLGHQNNGGELHDLTQIHEIRIWGLDSFCCHKWLRSFWCDTKVWEQVNLRIRSAQKAKYTHWLFL